MLDNEQSIFGQFGCFPPTPQRPNGHRIALPFDCRSLLGNFLPLCFQVLFFAVFWVGVLAPLFATLGPQSRPRPPKMEVLGAKILPKSTPEPKNRFFENSLNPPRRPIRMRGRPFQKSIKIDPAPLQVVVRVSSSCWDPLFPAFFRFLSIFDGFWRPLGGTFLEKNVPEG